MELERYRDLAFGTALSLLGDYHLAEDAVQEAFVEAIRCWDRLENPDARGAWLRGIVRHRCFRLLRKRDVEYAAFSDVTGGEEPWERVARDESHTTMLRRVRSLPRPLREVVVLHYLRGCPQREVAAFLDIPDTTVNNRLHRARRLLKGEPMKFETIESGTVVRAERGVVDVRFAPDAVPDVFDALAPAKSAANLRVAQILDDGVVRCLHVGGDLPSPGQNVVNRTADGGTYLAAIADDAALATTVAALGEERSGVIETGIKPIDLFCPLPARGNVGLFGTTGTGKMVLTMELAHRLKDTGPTLFYMAHRSEPALVRDLREEGEDFDRDAVWVLSERVSDREFARDTELFDTRIYCSPLMGVRNLWPATDAFHSVSKVDVGERHARVAREARDLIGRAHAIQMDPTLLELLACNAVAAARRRLATEPERIAALDDEQRSIVERSTRLSNFLTTPFFVVGEDHGIKGVSVPLEATLDGVESILAGDCDDVPARDLYMIGALPS